MEKFRRSTSLVCINHCITKGARAAITTVNSHTNQHQSPQKKENVFVFLFCDMSAFTLLIHINTEETNFTLFYLSRVLFSFLVLLMDVSMLFIHIIFNVLKNDIMRSVNIISKKIKTRH